MIKSNAFPTDQVPDHVLAIVSTLNALSNAQLSVVLGDFDVEYKVHWPPTRERPFHLVEVKQVMAQHLWHLVVKSLMTMIRYYEVPSNERLLPRFRSRRRVPPNEEAELKEATGLSGPALAARSKTLYKGIVLQLTTSPLEMRIEQILADRFPLHASLQQEYLEFLIDYHESISHVKPEHVGIKHLYQTSASINLAYLRWMERLAGRSESGFVRSHPYYDSSSGLIERIEQEADETYRGDRRIIDSWAQTLGHEGWYTWRMVSKT